jgi:hypothetical protein
MLIGIGNCLNKIERLWAEDGMVCVTSAEDGKTTRMTTRDAIKRAIAINQMQMNTKEEHKVKMLLVDQIKATVLEARKQQESPDSPRQALFINVLKGKNEKGQTVEPTIEMNVQFFMTKFPTLTEKEVELILTQPGMTTVQADLILGALHRSNGDMYLPGGEMFNKVMSKDFRPT